MSELDRNRGHEGLAVGLRALCLYDLNAQGASKVILERKIVRPTEMSSQSYGGRQGLSCLARYYTPSRESSHWSSQLLGAPIVNLIWPQYLSQRTPELANYGTVRRSESSSIAGMV
jgi:hypothetical protein